MFKQLCPHRNISASNSIRGSTEEREAVPSIAQRFAIHVKKNSSDHTRAVTPPTICQFYCEERKGREGVSMRSKLTAEWIKAIGDQKTASWSEVRVALHEFITIWILSYPFSATETRRRFCTLRWLAGVSLSLSARQFSRLNTSQFHLSPTGENKRISKVPDALDRPKSCRARFFFCSCCEGCPDSLFGFCLRYTCEDG